jgi:hypothetical protein
MKHLRFGTLERSILLLAAVAVILTFLFTYGRFDSGGGSPQAHARPTATAKPGLLSATLIPTARPTPSPMQRPTPPPVTQVANGTLANGVRKPLPPQTVISCDCIIDGNTAYDTGLGSQDTASVEVLLRSASVYAPYGGSYVSFTRNATRAYLLQQANVIKRAKLHDGFSSVTIYVYDAGALHAVSSP